MMRIMNAEQSIEFNDYKLLVRAVCSVLVLPTIALTVFANYVYCKSA